MIWQVSLNRAQRARCSHLGVVAFLTLLFCGPIEVKCKTNAKADIILLVDGSWSIGRLNFKTIRAFIGRMVGVFNIGPDRVQIGQSSVFYGWRECFILVNGEVICVYCDPDWHRRLGSVQRWPPDRVAPKCSQNPYSIVECCDQTAI